MVHPGVQHRLDRDPRTRRARRPSCSGRLRRRRKDRSCRVSHVDRLPGHVLLSSGGYSSVTTRSWGNPGDLPVPGDYDGDGSTDLCRVPANHRHVVRPRRRRAASTASREFQWGLPGDQPAPGDYDGDRITDVAVNRPNTGQWFIRHSSTDFTTSESFQWGLAGDVPVPGDYDGDSMTDLAVYRPSNGTWYIAHVDERLRAQRRSSGASAPTSPAPNSPIAYALARPIHAGHTGARERFRRRPPVGSHGVSPVEQHMAHAAVEHGLRVLDVTAVGSEWRHPGAARLRWRRPDRLRRVPAVHRDVVRHRRNGIRFVPMGSER